MEQELKPGEIRAVIQGMVDESGAPAALSPDDPRLRQGVSQEDDAVISRWWVVSFFEGTRQQQEARLKELNNPRL